MYVPTIFVALFIAWMLTDGGKHSLSGWWCAIGFGACAIYAPESALIVLAILAVILLPIGLFFLYATAMHLVEKGAKALPACWLFDGAEGPPVATPKLLKNDDGPRCNDYHSFDGWIEAYKAWEAGKPIPFNAHNVHWRYGDDNY
jgi:hypothetical protein